MLMNQVLELAESLSPGVAEILMLLVMRVARCNDRIRQPILGT
jgi:hypothetical protein